MKLYEYTPEDGNYVSRSVFLCHQTNATGKPTVCRGWLTVEADSLAVRLAMVRRQITVEQRDAPSKVPLYATGAEAADAGLDEVDEPSLAARRMIDRLTRKGVGKP